MYVQTACKCHFCGVLKLELLNLPKSLWAMLHLGTDTVFPDQSQFYVPKSNKTSFFSFILLEVEVEFG